MRLTLRQPTIAAAVVLQAYAVYGAAHLWLVHLVLLRYREVAEGAGCEHLGSAYIGANGVFMSWSASLAPFGHPQEVLGREIERHEWVAGPLVVAVPTASELFGWLPQIAFALLVSFIAVLLLPRLLAVRAPRWVGREIEWLALPLQARLSVLRRATRAAVIVFTFAASPVALIVWFLFFPMSPTPGEVADSAFPGYAAAAVIPVLAALLAARVGASWIRGATRRLGADLLQTAGKCRMCGYSTTGLPVGTKCPECGAMPSEQVFRWRLPRCRGLIRAAAYSLIGLVLAIATIWSWLTLSPGGVSSVLQGPAMYVMRFGTLFGWLANGQGVFWRTPRVPAVIRWNDGEGLVAYRVMPPGPDGQVEVVCVWGWKPNLPPSATDCDWTLKTEIRRAPAASGAAYFDIRFAPGKRFYVVLSNREHMPSEGTLYGRPDAIADVCDVALLGKVSAALSAEGRDDPPAGLEAHP